MTCLCNVKVEKHPSSLEGFESRTNKVAITLRTHAVTGSLKLRCQYVEIVCIKSSNQYVNISFLRHNTYVLFLLNFGLALNLEYKTVSIIRVLFCLAAFCHLFFK